MIDLVQYLDEIAQPTLNDFEKHPGSRRLCFLACVATFHAVDYLAFPKKSSNLRQRWRQLSQDFAIVDDVAHTFKHVATPSAHNPRLMANEVQRRPPAVWGTAVWGLSRWSDPDGGVEMDGVAVDLLNVVQGAVAFLRSLTSAPLPAADHEIKATISSD